MKAFTLQEAEQRIRELQSDIATLKTALRTTIAWIASSAGSPLSHGDAKRLIEMVGPER